MELLSLPTAPFAEGRIADYVRRFARGCGLLLRTDRAGNVILRYRCMGQGRPPRIGFAAHMDHPGFIAEAMAGPKTLMARWFGGVEAGRFRGTRVRFWTPEGTSAGRIMTIQTEGNGPRQRVLRARLWVEREVEPGTVGMWDLPDPQVRDGRVYARGCDDIAGVAAILSLLKRLAGIRKPADITALLTRAEEAGFIGAIAAARHRAIPKTVPIFSLECSKALPDSPVGGGPIVRVGDATSMFSPELTHLATRAARGLASRSKKFAFQRKLMDGGTCESTVYYQYGYRTTGLCLALGNYHNMPEQGGIEWEFIDLRDYERLVDLMEAIVDLADEAGPPMKDVRSRLEGRYEAHQALLGPVVKKS